MGLADRDYMKKRYRRLRGLEEFPTPVRQKAKPKAPNQKIIIGTIAALSWFALAYQYRETILNVGYHSQPLPLSGQGWSSRAFDLAPKTAGITILTGQDNAVIELYNPKDDTHLMSVIVRAHDSREFPTPDGSYILKIGRGHTWYGQDHLFGRTMTYQRSIGLLTVEKNTKHNLDLTGMTGNLPMTTDTTN